jgi:hypothetical protein
MWLLFKRKTDDPAGGFMAGGVIFYFFSHIFFCGRASVLVMIYRLRDE